MSEFADGLDVIVCNYRTPKLLQRFLDSVERRKGSAPISLWIVNNLPEREDLEVAWNYLAGDFTKQERPRNAVSVFHEQNLGYAKACNEAARWGMRRWIAFFNADCEFLESGDLDDIWRTCVQHEGEWSVWGPKQLDDDGRISHAGIFGSNTEPRIRGWRSVDDGFDDVRSDCVSVSGSAYIVHREAWDTLTRCPTYQAAAPGAVGAFLPTAHYYEETFCSYHARQHGYAIGYDGTVTMRHSWHKASPVGGPQDQAMPQARELFRAACDAHQIAHD